MEVVSQKLGFGERPANLEPLEALLARLLAAQRPEYMALLAEYQAKAADLVVKHRVYQNLGLFPIEEDFFYGQFLKVLVTRPKQFDIRRLNLAAWIQEKGVEYFQGYILRLGLAPQLPPLFRWHYLLFDRIGEIVGILEGELAQQEKEERLRQIGQETTVTEVREEARRLVERRLGR